MRFLTKETFKAPPTAEVLALIPAEQAKVKELIEQGLIAAVYVAADQSGAWMVWNVDSQATLARIHRRYDVTAAEWAMRGKRRRWSGHDFWQLGPVSVFSRRGETL